MNSFVEKLEERTAQGKVSWEPTSRDGVFRASFGTGSVTIAITNEDSVAPDVIIRIYDSENRLLESVVDTELKREGAFAAMYTMYQQARGKALRIDETLDSIMNELEEGEGVADDEVPF